MLRSKLLRGVLMRRVSLFTELFTQIVIERHLYIFTPTARRAWRSCKFAPFLVFFHLSMSKVGLPLMGDTAGFFLLLSALLHIM